MSKSSIPDFIYQSILYINAYCIGYAAISGRYLWAIIFIVLAATVKAVGKVKILD